MRDETGTNERLPTLFDLIIPYALGASVSDDAPATDGTVIDDDIGQN